MRQRHGYLKVIDDAQRRRGLQQENPIKYNTVDFLHETHRMLERLRNDLSLSEDEQTPCKRYRALEGRIDIVLIKNPDDKILHTVLVEKNGFIHALTFATPHEGQAGRLWGPVTYERWIQPD